MKTFHSQSEWLSLNMGLAGSVGCARVDWAVKPQHKHIPQYVHFDWIIDYIQKDKKSVTTVNGDRISQSEWLSLTVIWMFKSSKWII